MMDPEIPDRSLSDEARVRRRAELLAAVREGQGRSRRWLVPAAAAAAVAAVGVTAWLAIELGASSGTADPPETPQVAGSREAEPTPSDATSGAPASPRTAASSAPSAADCGALDPYGTDPLDGPPPWKDSVTGPVLQAYRDILAAHLDPQGEHLDARVTNVQSGGDSDCGYSSLGTKLGWSSAGEGGLGVVQVEVNRGERSGQIRFHHRGWRPVPGDLPGVVAAKVAEHAGGVAVIVTRADGLTVAIDADTLFGNNSEVAISGFGFTTDELLRAAADPGFRLP